MGNKIRDAVVKQAISQIGYKETGTNKTKYAEYFDKTAWQFFNTKKQGAEWCSLFVHWCLCQVITPDKVRKALGEPEPKNNCGAGVPYLYNYMKAKKLIVKTPQTGDIIFFNTKTHKCGHVGIVEKVDSQVHTIEGNKSNMVKRCTYPKTSVSVYGYARVDWSQFPDPEPDPPKEKTYMVEVRTLKYVKNNTMKGEDVKSVQAIVGAKQDGSFGPDTEKAVKSWQSAHGLTADGSWGPKSWDKAVGAK